MVGFYNAGRRSRKWWKRCFSYILECSFLNAYVLHLLAYPHLHQATGRQKFDFLKFRLEVATQLINSFSSRQRAANQTSNIDRLKIHLGHWPILVEDKRDCIVCRDTSNRWNLPRKEGRHQTRNKCSYCNVYLCIDKERDCFTKYHTVMHYTLWLDCIFVTYKWISICCIQGLLSVTILLLYLITYYNSSKQSMTV